ncbi:MAG: hypothetical protein WC829_11425 [Hyphomicrobium sp.]|jgi:hypothetical protein
MAGELRRRVARLESDNEAAELTWDIEIDGQVFALPQWAVRQAVEEAFGSAANTGTNPIGAASPGGAGNEVA